MIPRKSALALPKSSQSINCSPGIPGVLLFCPPLVIIIGSVSMTLPLAPVIAALAAAALVAWIYRQLSASRRQFEELPDGWERIDPDRYAPLARLLASGDFQYLRTLPGYDLKLDRTMRLRRLEAFRYYLAELTRDFHALQRVGLLLVASGQASPMLREQLFLARVDFTRALWRVRIEALLFRYTGRAVDAHGLLTALRNTCGALQIHPRQAAV